MTIFRIALRAVICAALSAGPSGCGRDRDEPTNEVVLYCSVDQGIAEGIIKQFESTSGLRVLVRYDEEATKTTGLVQRLRAEAKAPAADVFWSSEIFQTIRLASEGLLTAYDGEAAEGWPEQFADPNGLWHAFALRGRVIAYNTRRVRAGDAPKKLEDLLDEKWKGRLVMARPQFGTTRGDVASWFAHYGGDEAKRILRGLKANGVRFVQGNSTAVRMVGRGEADVCFTDTDDVYVARGNGMPIGMNPLDQGGEGALAIPNTAALVAAGPNADNAKKLLAFLLSEHVEAALAASDSHNMPIRATPADASREYALGRPLKVDYRRVAARMPAAMRAVAEIFD
jgi:iron(III) transport system substrate-binding protein